MTKYEDNENSNEKKNKEEKPKKDYGLLELYINQSTELIP